MNITSSNVNYANALIQISSNYDAVLKDLKIAQEIIEQSPDLKEVLGNPTISENIKISIIEDVFKKQIDEKISRFLQILVNKKRFQEFDGIIEAYKKEVDKINGIKQVKIVSAVELDKLTKDKIAKTLEIKLDKKIVTQWQTNPEIIAGLVFKIEDDVIDTSLKYKLENLSKKIQ